MPNNLTRAEARDRVKRVRDVAYDVTLDLTGDGPTYRSDTVVRFECLAPGQPLFLDFTAPEVHELTLNGEPLPLDSFDGDRITLAAPAGRNELRVVGSAAYMHTGVGLHRFIDPVDKQTYLYTQFETFDAHRVYPCFDQPDVKGRFALTAIAPPDWVVVSNTTPSAEPDRSLGGEWRFPATPPLSPYVTAVVAGPYHEVRDWHGDIPLGIYCRQSMAQFLDPDEILTVTKQGFDWFREAFDYPYPFGKYDQLFVPEFNAGAMENVGCVTFLEDYVFRSKVTDAARERRAETILHEMAHMWFGNLVTMRWWDDLWLNESFATYASVLCQTLATRFVSGWTTFANNEKTWAYKQDQLPSTHPVVADMTDIHAVEVNFDGITYAKGASVLKQLVAWVGQDRFLAGLRTYFRRHEYGNTELKDLLAVLEEASGRDLSSWSKEWLETAGVNTLRADFDTDADGNFTRFAIRQEAPEDWPTLRSHRIAVGLYDVVGEELRRRDRIELDVVGASTDVEALTGVRRPDLVLVNDDDLTYAKLRLDDRSLATVTARLGSLPDSLPRALCWAASWDMTRDAELAARDYLMLVLGNVSSESDVGVVQTLVAQCLSAIFNYAVPTAREELLESLATAAYAQLSATEPGSDHQLAWARAFVSAARSPGHLAVVSGLLSGGIAVPGLAMDADLRWHLVRALAARGVAGEDMIADELERDPTAAGHRQGAAARAGVPTAAAKAEAWQAIMYDESLPNAVLSATMSGFQQPEQADLLEPYADRFFDEVARIWDTRTNEVAINIITSTYPYYVIDEATIRRTDDYLRTAQPEHAVRRLLLEGRDGVARALRARACDAAAATR